MFPKIVLLMFFLQGCGSKAGNPIMIDVTGDDNLLGTSINSAIDTLVAGSRLGSYSYSLDESEIASALSCTSAETTSTINGSGESQHTTSENFAGLTSSTNLNLSRVTVDTWSNQGQPVNCADGSSIDIQFNEDNMWTTEREISLTRARELNATSTADGATASHSANISLSGNQSASWVTIDSTVELSYFGLLTSKINTANSQNSETEFETTWNVEESEKVRVQIMPQAENTTPNYTIDASRIQLTLEDNDALTLEVKGLTYSSENGCHPTSGSITGKTSTDEFEINFDQDVKFRYFTFKSGRQLLFAPQGCALKER